MIIQIDTTKKPTREDLFIADLIILSAKNDCAVDESIKQCQEILQNK